MQLVELIFKFLTLGPQSLILGFQLGYLMLILNMGIGSVTPPVGSCLFVGCGIANVKIEGVTKYIVPIFAAMVVSLFLVTFIPQIPLSVPYWSGLIDSMGWMN